MGLRRAAVVMIAATLGASLVACTDDGPEPTFESAPTSATSATVPSPLASTTSAAPTPTPTPTPTGPVEPTLPEAATKNSVAGAKAFVRWWVDLVNYSTTTGDVVALKNLHDSRCTSCDGGVKAITDAYDHGGHIEGGEWSVGGLRELPLDHEADVALFAPGRSTAQVVFHADGSETKYASGKFYLYAYVIWTNSRWSMRWVRSPAARD